MAAVNLRERLMFGSEVRDGCWIWKGGRAGAGYGVLRIAGIQTYAHRMSYREFVGEIPPGLEIDHLCRTPLCINPAHLEAVTHAENRKRARLERCKRGHLLAASVQTSPSGARNCRKCGALRAHEYRRRRALA